MYLECSSKLGRSMEADFAKRSEHLTKEERMHAFNVNMMRDGQLSHDAVQLTKDVDDGKYGPASQGRRWLAGNYEAGDVVFHGKHQIISEKSGGS